MTKPVTGLNVFAAQTGPIPLSQLDADISALQNAINDTATYSNYYVDSSAAPNQLTVTTTAGVTFAYGAGVMLQVKIAVTNTAAAVNINVNALGNVALKHFDGTNPAIGELGAGRVLVIIHDGVNFVILSTTTTSATDVQAFFANGVWTKPPVGGKTTRIICIAAGGGGASGSRRAPGIDTAGGSGGGGGGYTVLDVPTSALGATEAVVVPVGGLAGAAVTVDNTNGNPGSAGGDVSFGAWASATGGKGGAAIGGNADGGLGLTGFGACGGASGAGFAGASTLVWGGLFTRAFLSAGPAFIPLMGVIAGGVAGSGVTNLNAGIDGIVGQISTGIPATPGVAGLVAGPANGGAAVVAGTWRPGACGGSGAGIAAGVGGNAGPSAGFGAGGSGGGGSRNGNNSGAGAAGAPALCVAITLL